jgi:retron-type reverse transcriptase
VVHHALCNVIVPRIEQSFIDDSYANRLGYGTHRALRRFIQFTRRHRYILQCDIYKYFPSIDHELLKSIIRRHLKCPQTLWLLDTIIDNSNPQEPVINYYPGDDLLTPITRRKGLPIGNLTSQFLANVYLNQFDHWCKETLKAQQYLRYVDDFALFSDDRSFLVAAKAAIEEKLASSLRLRLHPVKSQIFATEKGANFVGFRVLPKQIRVRNDNLRRGRRYLRQMQRDYRRGHLTQQQIQQRLQSWEAHLKHGDTYRLRQCIFQQWSFEEEQD